MRVACKSLITESIPFPYHTYKADRAIFSWTNVRQLLIYGRDMAICQSIGRRYTAQNCVHKMFSGSLMEGYISVIIFGWIPSYPADLVSYSFFSTTSVEKKMLKLSRVLYFTCKLAICHFQITELTSFFGSFDLHYLQNVSGFCFLLSKSCCHYAF